MCITSFCLVAVNFLLGKQIYFFLCGAPSKLEEWRGELGPCLGEAAVKQRFIPIRRNQMSNLRSKLTMKGLQGQVSKERTQWTKVESGAGRSWGNRIGDAGWGRTCPWLSKIAAALLSCKCHSHWALLIPVPCLKQVFVGVHATIDHLSWKFRNGNKKGCQQQTDLLNRVSEYSSVIFPGCLWPIVILTFGIVDSQAVICVKSYMAQPLVSFSNS